MYVFARICSSMCVCVYCMTLYVWEKTANLSSVVFFSLVFLVIPVVCFSKILCSTMFEDQNGQPLFKALVTGG